MAAPKLKIGFVFDASLDKNEGVAQYVLILSRWLASEGHEVHYLVGETKRTDIPNLHSLSRNITVRFNHNRTPIPLPVRMKSIRRLVTREQFDVLHVQVPYSPALAAKVIRAASPRTAVVGTFHVAPHSRLVTTANRMLGVLVRSTLKRFDVMLATSEPARQFALQTFKIDSKVEGLPIELDKFVGAKPLTRYAKGLNVGFLGRLVERKGCGLLLKAVAHAVAEGIWPHDARVIVCSDGPLRAELEKYTADHQLTDIVEFTGFISEADKPRYLASADVVVYPSTGGESFGVVLLEAFGAARGMVLAGNNPGYASVMAPRPEALFDPLDTTQFAVKLVNALIDPRARQAAHAWQQAYSKQFDVARVGARTLAIYQQALHKRRG